MTAETDSDLVRIIGSCLRRFGGCTKPRLRWRGDRGSFCVQRFGNATKTPDSVISQNDLRSDRRSVPRAQQLTPHNRNEQVRRCCATGANDLPPVRRAVVALQASLERFSVAPFARSERYTPALALRRGHEGAHGSPAIIDRAHARCDAQRQLRRIAICEAHIVFGLNDDLAIHGRAPHLAPRERNNSPRSICTSRG